MFEIMHKICVAIGFPEVDLEHVPLDRTTLLPLIMGAHETRAALGTSREYFPYDKHGAIHPEFPDVLRPENEYVLDFLPPFSGYMPDELI